MMNTINVTDKNVTKTTLTALVGTEYDINKVADFVGMKECRVAKEKQFGICTFHNNCEIKETILTDNSLVLMEGRYVEENKHDSAYHYVYLDCPEGDWRFKITVDAEEKIVGVKEIYTIDHAIKIFKQEVIGEKYDELKTMDKFAEIMKKYAVEEKGETELQTVEGTCASETGKELNGEGFFVPVENETIAFVAYDEDYNIVEVTAMKSNDQEFQEITVTGVSGDCDQKVTCLRKSQSGGYNMVSTANNTVAVGIDLNQILDMKYIYKNVATQCLKLNMNCPAIFTNHCCR